MHPALTPIGADRQVSPSGLACRRPPSKGAIVLLASLIAVISARIETTSMQTATVRSATIGLFGHADDGRMQSGRGVV